MRWAILQIVLLGVETVEGAQIVKARLSAVGLHVENSDQGLTKLRLKLSVPCTIFTVMATQIFTVSDSDCRLC